MAMATEANLNESRDMTVEQGVSTTKLPISAMSDLVARSSPECPTCGSSPGNGKERSRSWIYAIGRIEPRFPTLALEKEFAQATGREKTVGLTDRQALHTVLSKPENRYLARQLCWILTVEGLETYVLRPRDPADVALLVEAVRSNPGRLDLDVV